jgi:hypothetical protein
VEYHTTEYLEQQLAAMRPIHRVKRSAHRCRCGEPLVGGMCCKVYEVWIALKGNGGV